MIQSFLISTVPFGIRLKPAPSLEQRINEERHKFQKNYIQTMFKAVTNLPHDKCIETVLSRYQMSNFYAQLKPWKKICWLSEIGGELYEDVTEKVFTSSGNVSCSV